MLNISLIELQERIVGCSMFRCEEMQKTNVTPDAAVTVSFHARNYEHAVQVMSFYLDALGQLGDVSSPSSVNVTGEDTCITYQVWKTSAQKFSMKAIFVKSTPATAGGHNENKDNALGNANDEMNTSHGGW